MGMVNIQFSVLGEQQFNRAIRGVEGDVNDLSVIWERISDDFRDTEESQFKAEGAFEGNTKWADLSPTYAIQKAFRWGSVPILTASGRMRASLSNKGAEGHVNEIQPLGMTVGTSVEYAGYHQTGTFKMPARPPIQVSEPQKTRWGRIMHSELHSKINKNVEQRYKGVNM